MLKDSQHLKKKKKNTFKIKNKNFMKSHLKKNHFTQSCDHYEVLPSELYTHTSQHPLYFSKPSTIRIAKNVHKLIYADWWTSVVCIHLCAVMSLLFHLPSCIQTEQPIPEIVKMARIVLERPCLWMRQRAYDLLEFYFQIWPFYFH